MQAVIADLKAAGIEKVYLDEPMALHTTWKVGGPADLFVVPDSKVQLIDTVRIMHRHTVPWMSIGRGSNMLVSDKGIRGAVIKQGAGLDYVRFQAPLVYAGGAFSFIKLSVVTGREGLTGLEYAGGIPGSVGGAVYMNAGANGSDVSQILQTAEILLQDGTLVQWTAEDLQFRYRHSLLHEVPGIVTEAVFRLKHGDRKEIAAAMAAYKHRRLQTQPLQAACAGSVFRNPENHHAAKLIEQAGLKGLKVGGAEVSELHANFIVNTGNATARDVLTLMGQIQAKVESQFGIALVPEVLVVGER